jgi:hypothetical protein
MAQTIAIVTSTGKDGSATVVAEKGQGCGSCGTVSHCYRGQAGRTEETTALNRAGAKQGIAYPLPCSPERFYPVWPFFTFCLSPECLPEHLSGEYQFSDINGSKGGTVSFSVWQGSCRVSFCLLPFRGSGRLRGRSCRSSPGF